LIDHIDIQPPTGEVGSQPTSADEGMADDELAAIRAARLKELQQQQQQQPHAAQVTAHSVRRLSC
jgi:hypothetical protein